MLIRKPIIGDNIYFHNPKNKKREYFGKVVSFRGHGNEIAVMDTVHKTKQVKYRGKMYPVTDMNEFVHTFHINGKERLNLKMEIDNVHA